MSSSFPKPITAAARRPERIVHKRSADERQRLLARFRRSGQSQKRFCEANGLSLSTLQYWLGQQRLQGEPREGSFVQLPAPVASACLSGVGDLRVGAVQIRLPSQIELQVAAGADPAWIGALVRGMLAC